MDASTQQFGDEDTRRINPARTGAISVALILHITAFALLLAPVRPADLGFAPTPPVIEVMMPERVRPIPPPPVVPITTPRPPTLAQRPRQAAPPAAISNPEPAVSMADLVEPTAPTLPDLGDLPALGDGAAFAPELIGSASYLSAPAPRYPTLAIKRGWEGEVLMIVTIGANGAPEAVELHQSSGHAVLDRAAIEQVQKRWRFRPLLVDGSPTRSRAMIPVRFSLQRG